MISKSLVAQNGIEGTLEILRGAGVYVTYGEFKGREPIRRGSLVIPVESEHFDNPLLKRSIRTSSGGSRGKPAPSAVSLEHIADFAPLWGVWFDARGWMEREFVIWATAHLGMTERYLYTSKYGVRNEKWFSAGLTARLQDRVMSSLTHGLVRLAAGLPRAEFVPFDQPERVCAFLHDAGRQGRKICLNTSPSAGVRISMYAQAHHISLQHVAVLCGGEPLTPTRKTMIEASGAEAVATYGSSEAGGIGVQCQNSQLTDEVHVFSDAVAVILHPLAEPIESEAQAIAFTSLLPSIPKILFNTIIGDYGVLSEKDCACGLGALGYRTHLHSIRSFEKFTGDGVTVLGADILQVIDQVLAPRFGGSGLDYQLIETQDSRGIAAYTLRISPSVGKIDERACLEAFKQALIEQRAPYRLMLELWDRVSPIQILRAPPLMTSRGKILPFYTLQ